VNVIINEAVDDKQLGERKWPGREGRFTRCLCPVARYPCYATEHMTFS